VIEVRTDGNSGAAQLASPGTRWAPVGGALVTLMGD
jgi:hypothetical protein